jgi:hypothetical protein
LVKAYILIQFNSIYLCAKLNSPEANYKDIIQFNSIYLCAKLNSPEANYKVSTGKKMGRVRK